ncbi:MAG: hypothetical protein EOP84_08450 [Verrucomicrobiaceae bacterium]|nr:MAG: hypothetical protein EOP84_08450 [Verrucomicrobiaceae bacterium]
MEPAKETHTAGPFQGWSVERVQDDKGRLGTLKISQGANTVHSFGFGYDNHSRLSLSSSSQLTSTYTIKGTGATETLTRGILQTSWGYDTLDRLSGLTNNNTQGDDFNYSFTGPNDAPARDPRHRIKQKSASIGASWIDLDYDDADQLRFAKAGGREFSYGFDDRGNRIDQGAEVANSVNLLNQIHGRLSKRTYGVRGEVNPGASVKVFDLWNPLGRSLPDPVTGTFAGTWPLPATANTQAQRLDLLVRGTLLPSTTGGKVAISDREISLLVPPVQEALAYDGAGRLKSDAFWGYSWDSFGRLRQMIRKPGVSTRTWSHRRNSRLHLRCPRQADTEDPYR